MASSASTPNSFRPVNVADRTDVMRAMQLPAINTQEGGLWAEDLVMFRTLYRAVVPIHQYRGPKSSPFVHGVPCKHPLMFPVGCDRSGSSVRNGSRTPRLALGSEGM